MYQSTVTRVLDAMQATFTDKDSLLRSVGMISLYFLLFERALKTDRVELLLRSDFGTFEETREKNRRNAEVNIADSDYELLEFDRYAQSPNDGIALRYRLAVIDHHLYQGEMGFASDTVRRKEEK